MVGENIQ